MAFFSDASIDFLNHYRLVEGGKVEMYARAFVVEDEDQRFSVNARVKYSGFSRPFVLTIAKLGKLFP